MRGAIAMSPFLLAASFATHAEAGAIYRATDLGAGYSLRSNAGGRVDGVANSDGSVVYAFSKSPVIPIDIRTSSGGHAYSYTQMTLQNGSHQAGYVFDYGSYSGNHPTFEAYGNGWQTYSGSPVLDLNKSGQVVGTSLNLNVGSTGPPEFAAFSDPDGRSHGFGAQTVDNLNNYIDPLPGVNLTSAVKIDDLGRILAIGSDGHDYLLTPKDLGSVATVPEPTTWALMGMISVALSIRSARQRPKARCRRCGA